MSSKLSRNSGGPNQAPDRRLQGTSSPAKCQALSETGQPCHRILQDARHNHCGQHHRDSKTLHQLYKTQEARLETLSDEDDATDKIGILEEVIRLRQIQSDRFFNQSRDEGRRGHARWRLLQLAALDKLKATVLTGPRSEDKTLAATVAKPDSSQSPQQATEAQKPSHESKVYRSLLDPEVPLEALGHLPRDSLTVMFKTLFPQTTDGLVEKIYIIMPSLNDSEATLLDSKTSTRREPDKGDLVIRYFLREFLIWEADTATLDRARRTKSIDKFLRQSNAELLERIRRFLDCFGRADTLHFLRDAVYDSLNSSSSETSPTMVLGEVMPLEDKDRRMSVEAWDVIFCFFGDVVGWCQLGHLCFCFDDLLLVKRLTILRRYDIDATDENGADRQKWYDPDNEVAQECGLAVMRGFLAMAKGFSDPPYTPVTMESGMARELESRNYVVGRIGTSHPLVNKVIQELKDRVAHIIVRDYESRALDWTSPITTENDDDVWITRTRSAGEAALLSTKPWKVEWSLSRILDDIRYVRRLLERERLDDCRYVIIVDRLPGKAFQLLEIVALTFLKVAGYPAPRVIHDNFIRAVLPDEEQRLYENATISSELASTSLTAHEPHYEGSRVRDWTMLDRRDGPLESDTCRPGTLPEVQLTANIIGDMESRGLVTKLKTHEPAFSHPILYQASDGQYDVFFQYGIPKTRLSVPKDSPTATDPSVNLPPNALDAFARSYQAAHPDAVFAKGIIHVHYCAWPMPCYQDDPLRVFVDLEGHLYRWNVVPFDRPFSSMSWQLFVHRAIHANFPFVLFLRTTFVICAETIEAAEGNLRLVEEVTKAQNWKLSVKDPRAWSSDLDALALNTIWRGVSET